MTFTYYISEGRLNERYEEGVREGYKLSEGRLNERYEAGVREGFKLGEGRLNERYDQGVKYGEERGITIGEERNKKEIVIRMYRANVDIKDIAMFVGISVDKVQEYIESLQGA